MHSLFESDSFAVVQVDYGDQTGYELVDKRAEPGTPAAETFLQGALARAFEDQIAAWKLDTPTQEVVDEKIDALMTTNRIPLYIH